MRDPHRIDVILREIWRVWEKNPDWRLGQIIENALHPPGDPARGPDTSWLFYIEDDEMLEALKKL